MPTAAPAIGARHRPSLGVLLLPWGAVLAGLLAEDWIAGLAVLVLWAGWRVLPHDEGPPVLALAFSMQWVQVTCGLFYYAFTGRQVPAMLQSDYRTMVMIGLGCLMALLIGLVAGAHCVSARPAGTRPGHRLSTDALMLSYALSLVVAATAYGLAGQVPQLAQGIIILGYFRFAVLFLCLRRLLEPPARWIPFSALLGFELLLGFTAYFAEFRESMMMAALALLERFDRRQFAHWARLAVVGAVIFASGLMWISIRDQYRRQLQTPGFAASRVERLRSIGALAADWVGSDALQLTHDMDDFVDRVWTIYYPALAVHRVPAVLPHEHGAILWAAVRHIFTPRLLFPEKPILPSDSDMVRRYSGVWVAGPESGTSIAFGYAAESYVDFGLPWMFLPVLVYGLGMGVAYRLLLRAIHHPELAVALVTIVFWIALSQFERSWIKTLGHSGNLILWLGGAVWLADRVLTRRRMTR